MENLRVHVASFEAYAVITVAGDVDATTTGQLHDAVVRAQEISAHLVFDLAEMSFMDSAGIRVLLDALHHTQTNGGSIALSGPRPSPRKVMELVGLADHIPIYDSPAEAVAGGPA
ncbi:STAS domain-containing protein [Herbidospora sp. RD11066]